MAARFRGALVGAAVGDALGAPFEGTTGTDPKGLDELLSAAPLRYTDDTAMTIGVARSLIERGGLDPAHMAKTFARDYAAEPWRGYGATPPRIFALIEQGVPWSEAPQRAFGGQGSFGNGAAMRVSPVGLVGFRDFDLVRAMATTTALITHSHPLGVGGAVLQALAVAVAIRLGSDAGPEDLIGALPTDLLHPTYVEALGQIRDLLPDASADDVIAELGRGIEAHRSVPTALYCFLRDPGSFHDAVTYAISLGGDTDTIASMTGAIAGAALGEEAVPTAWVEAVEGTASIRILADDLLAVARSDDKGKLR